MQGPGGVSGVVSAVLVALTVACCGENDPGDPVSVARDFASPIPPGGWADVYCNPIPPFNSDDQRQECSIDLKVSGTTGVAEAEAWLIAVGQRVRPLIGRVFTFDGRPFFWTGVVIDRSGESGRLEFFCRGTVRPIYYAPSAPTAPGTPPALPATNSWFHSVGDARAAGCRLAIDRPAP